MHKKRLYMSLIITLIIAHSYSIHCMLSPSTILTKLDDGHTYNVPKLYTTLSITMLEKYLTKKKLSIEQSQPIIITNTSPAELGIFSCAAYHQTKKTFSHFFDELCLTKQKELISACGKEKLNSPLMTCLLAKKCLPGSVIGQHIIPHLEQKAIEYLLQSAMIPKNIPNKTINFSLFMAHLTANKNGHVNKVPIAFKPHPTLRTSENPFFFDSNARVIVDNGRYYVTSVVNDKNKHKNRLFVRNEKKSSFCKKLPTGLIFKGTFSTNGCYMVIQYLKQPQNNTLLLKIDPLNKDIISDTIILPNSLGGASDIQFNSSSSLLFYNSRSYGSPFRSFFYIYDLNNKKEYITYFNHWRVCTSFNQDYTRMAVAKLEEVNNRAYFFDIYSIENIHDIYQITSVDISRGFSVVSLQYSPRGNLLAVKLNNRNVLLVKENKSGSIRLFHMLHQSTIKEPSIYASNLLFTPNGHFLIDTSKNWKEQEGDFVSQNVTLWNVKDKKHIISTSASLEKTCSTEIIMNTTANRFITPIIPNALWHEYVLQTRKELATCQFITNNQDLPVAYALRRLFIAKKTKSAVIPEHVEMLKEILKDIPRASTQTCLYNYLWLD